MNVTRVYSQLAAKRLASFAVLCSITIQTIPFFGMHSYGVTKSWLSKQHKYAILSRAFYATVSKRQCILFMKYNWCEHDRFGHFDNLRSLSPMARAGFRRWSKRQSSCQSTNQEETLTSYSVLILIKKIDRSIIMPLRFLLIFKFNNHGSM